MAKQSYPSLFTLTIGFVVCNFDCKPMSLVRIWHRQLVLSRDHFSNYLKQHKERTLFLQTASVHYSELLQFSLKIDLVNNGYSLFAVSKPQYAKECILNLFNLA